MKDGLKFVNNQYSEIERENLVDYKITDISLAEFGRREIESAEKEMPGLMSIREK